MKSVTIWYKDDELNHIEDGYDPNRKVPTPLFDSQKKSWKGGNWRAVEGILNDNHEVIEVNKESTSE